MIVFSRFTEAIEEVRSENPYWSVGKCPRARRVGRSVRNAGHELGRSAGGLRARSILGRVQQYLPAGWSGPGAQLSPGPVVGPERQCLPRVGTHRGRLISSVLNRRTTRPPFLNPTPRWPARPASSPAYASGVSAIKQSRHVVTEIPGPASLELTRRRAAAVSA